MNGKWEEENRIEQQIEQKPRFIRGFLFWMDLFSIPDVVSMSLNLQHDGTYLHDSGPGVVFYQLLFLK